MPASVIRSPLTRDTHTTSHATILRRINSQLVAVAVAVAVAVPVTAMYLVGRNRVHMRIHSFGGCSKLATRRNLIAAPRPARTDIFVGPPSPAPRLLLPTPPLPLCWANAHSLARRHSAPPRSRAFVLSTTARCFAINSSMGGSVSSIGGSGRATIPIVERTMKRYTRGAVSSGRKAGGSTIHRRRGTENVSYPQRTPRKPPTRAAHSSSCRTHSS